MEIVKNFGLDPYLFGAQVINFLIILYLLKRFLYKPVLDMLKKREDAIKEGIKQAEDARILMEETLEKEKAILKKAQETARQTINEAREQALVTAVSIEERTKKQAEKIILEGREQIRLETEDAKIKLTREIGNLSVDFLKTATKEMFTQEEQNEVLQKATAKLKTND